MIPKQDWTTKPIASQDIVDAFEMPSLWGQLLHNRGITTVSQAREFLSSSTYSISPPLITPDMNKAVTRILKAFEKNEIIGIYGDFDADGITATAILFRTLSELDCKVIPYIPDRVKEGHGLNNDALRYLSKEGVTLLITVDCGITSIEEIHYAQSIGIDTIVTDHHVPSESLPDAHAFIEAKMPDFPKHMSELTGAGIALKLAEAICLASGKEPDKSLLQLAAIGTIADMGSLNSENRKLIKAGLYSMQVSPFLGVGEILTITSTLPENINSKSISFDIAPRINAPGRLGSASISLELLTTNSKSDAKELAKKVEEINQQRRRMSQSLSKMAEEQAKVQIAENESLIIVSGNEFTPGMAGLIASRIVEQCKRPTVVISTSGDKARASGRSTKEFDLKNIFDECKELFERYGGHKQAAGFTAEKSNLPHITESLRESAKKQSNEQIVNTSIVADAFINFSDISMDSYKFFQSLGPFGLGNPEPTFITQQVKVLQAKKIGQNKEHLKLTLGHNGAEWNGIAFNQATSYEASISEIDIVYSVEKDKFNRYSLQLLIHNIRPHAKQ
jgi:single-stranded-DNA-specific exonuclease